MPNEHRETAGADAAHAIHKKHFLTEPADEWQESLGRGGPVRSDEPELDYFFESTAAPMKPENVPERRSLRRMRWRTGGAQDHPGGAVETLLAASHRGKGPRGYRPTDERLRERVCERLADDPYVDASDIDVSVTNGEVTLSGSVETRQMKYIAEDVIADIAGVAAIHNSIQVRRDV